MNNIKNNKANNKYEILLSLPTTLEIKPYTDVKPSIQLYVKINILNRKTTTMWLQFYMSLKGRVLTTNTLMMFMLRYAIRFLEIPAQVQKDLQKEYFQMVWDDRSSGMINDFHACCSPMTGGMGCFDLDTIANTAAVTAVAKTFVRPNEPWVHLAKDIILRSALETQILTEAATSPWLRWFGSKHDIPPEL